MESTIELLKKYTSSPSLGERVEINEKSLLFSLRPYTTKRDTSILNTLFHMKELAQHEYVYDYEGSASYFFKIKDVVIEIDIAIDEFIDIKPYLWYQQDTIKEHISKAVELDQYLYSLLNYLRLQE